MSVARAVRAGRWVGIAAVSVALIATVGATTAAPHIPPSRMAALPRVTVWAWERREDLRDLDTRTTALAYLDRTIAIDAAGVRTVPRRQPMLLPTSSGLVRIAVVRIEIAPGTPLDEAMQDAAANAIAQAASGTGTSALQVDFDARLSERVWYAGLLRKLRAQIPPAMPLSITALASWCSYDGSWLRTLPIDEAVPMLFRMEPDRRRAGASGVGWGTGDFVLREPLCQGSVGLSTREAWPHDLRGRRVYLFADRGWARDGLEQTVRAIE